MSEDLNLFSLSDFRSRKMNLIAVLVLILTDIFIYLFGSDLKIQTDTNIHLVVHSFIIISLTAIVLSKEKIDDERSRLIRYSVFKLVFSVLVLGGVVSIFIISFLGIKDIPLLYIYYFFELIIVLTLCLKWYGMRKSPEWLYKESTSSESKNLFGLLTYLGLVFVVLYLLFF